MKSARQLFDEGYFHGEGSNYPGEGYGAWWEMNCESYMAAIRYALQCIKEVPRKWLDIGCAYGQVVAYAAGFGVDAFGLDISQYAVAQAKQRRTEVIRASAEALPFRSNVFEAISVLELVEHLSYPSKMIKEIDRVCCKASVILLSTPTKRAPSDSDATHIGIRPAHTWISCFAKVGFLPLAVPSATRLASIFNLASKIVPSRLRYVLFYFATMMVCPRSLQVILRKE